MKRTILLSILLMVIGCGGRSAHRSAKYAPRVPGGTMIEGVGLAIDASYDSRLDDLVPGYRVVNAVVVNNSFNVVFLNPDRDRWALRAGGKKAYGAIIDLKRADPEVWEAIPSRARRMLSYPLAIPIGARLVIDLFFPESVPVEDMTELSVRIASLEANFVIVLGD